MTVTGLVRRERSRLGIAILARGLAVGVAAAAVLLAASTIALGGARWITRPSAPLASWGVALVAAAIACWWARGAVRAAASSHAVARAIESERSLRRGSVRAALEVRDAGALGRYAADALASRLASVRGALAPAAQRTALRRGAIAALAAVAGLAVLGAAKGAAPDGWRAIRHPIGAFRGTILPPLVIENAAREIMRGEKMPLRIRAQDRLAIELHVRTTGSAWRTLALPVRGGEAATELGPLDADVRVVASDGRVQTDTLDVHVTDRPFVGDVAIRAVYPSYLGRATETIPTGEPARVPRGTVLSISGRASTMLDAIALAREKDTVRLRPDGHAFAGRLVARESGRWAWAASGARGAIADVPQPLELEVVADSAPRIDIVSPAHDTVVLADAQVALRLTAGDDHGLADITLRTTRRAADGTTMPPVVQELASPNATAWTGVVPLDLAPRQLGPGDVMSVVAAATDNSPWRQTTLSREIVLRVPTLTEQRDRARALADSTASEVASAARSERDLAQRTDEAARSRADRAPSSGSSQPNGTSAGQQGSSPKSMSYESAEQAKALAKEQQQLADRVRQAQQTAQALEQQLRAAGVMDSALTQQLHDAQQMLRDALTPELEKQLDDVLKATQQLSPDQARRAMQNLAQAQQKLREQLERSAEMLKRAAFEGSMQTLHDEARDIAKGEHQLADSLQRGGARGDSAAARDAQQLSQRSRDLSQHVSDLQKRLQQDSAQSGPQQLQGAPQRADSSAASVARAAPPNGEASKQGQQGQQGRQGQAGQQGQQAQQGQQGQQGERSRQGQSDPSRAQRSGAASQAAQQMDAVQQQLADARNQQIQEWKNQVTSELDRSIQETMQLARDQQRLADRARSGQTDGLRADQSAVQQGVQRIQQRLDQAARQSAHVSAQSQGAMADASQRVQAATRSSAESARGGGAQDMASDMDDAAEALNRAAASMVQDRARAANGASASGFSEMIQAMRDAAKQQGAVNSQSAGLLPVPGGQPSAQMMAQARALAQRQRDIANGIDNAGNGAQRAAELAKEMRQIADALDRGRVDPSLLERQQKLFHRLLDAGLTLEQDQREDQGKRQAETARIDTAITTGTVSSGRAVEKFREPTWNELRGLTPDERRAVLEYFKRINADQP
ncbi:MAG TPA: hypothetical protein VF118_13510 [Gemmatimonadaceae bacterium]